jgi:hypothetical protein
MPISVFSRMVAGFMRFCVTASIVFAVGLLYPACDSLVVGLLLFGFWDILVTAKHGVSISQYMMGIRAASRGFYPVLWRSIVPTALMLADSLLIFVVSSVFVLVNLASVCFSGDSVVDWMCESHLYRFDDDDDYTPYKMA